MIAAAVATEYLEKLGISVASVVVSAAVELIEEVEPDMIAAGYSDARQVLIQCMAVALIVTGAAGTRRIASQAAAYGASRSFSYDDKAMSDIRRELAFLDPAGTTWALIGPGVVAKTMLLVV